jgi:hypothetical protein
VEAPGTAPVVGTDVERGRFESSSDSDGVVGSCGGEVGEGSSVENRRIAGACSACSAVGLARRLLALLEAGRLDLVKSELAAAIAPDEGGSVDQRLHRRRLHIQDASP